MTSEQLQNLIPELRPKLVQTALRYVKNGDEAEDIVQDVLLKLWLLRGQVIGPVDALAQVMVRNLSLNHLRRKRYAQLTIDNYQLADETDMTADTEEQVARLMSLVEKLPDRQRVVLRLHDLEGMSYDEMARLTGTPVATLRQTVSRTRRHLRMLYLAMVSASVALLLTVSFGYRAFQNQQFLRRHEGSYIVVDGRRNDNLRQIRQQLELTLAQARTIETGVAEQAFVRQAEADVLQGIGDPEERRRMEQLLTE